MGRSNVASCVLDIGTGGGVPWDGAGTEGGGGGGGRVLRGGSVNERVVGIDGGTLRSWEGVRRGTTNFGSWSENDLLSSADIGLGL